MQNNSSFNKTISNLQNRGIGYSITKTEVLDAEGNPVLDSDGNKVYRDSIVINSIPQEELEVNRFFSLGTDCWFGGCEELREQYKTALAAENPEGCTGCQKGAIMRMFESKVRQALKAHNEHSRDTGTKELSRSDGESNAGVKDRTSVLRRATNCIKKIFRVGKK